MYYIFNQNRFIFVMICLTIGYRTATVQAHPCNRPCIVGALPMECNYTFVVEYYQTMSKACFSCPFVEADCAREDCVAADGVSRPIITINRQIPGPKIEVCFGDNINVAVENAFFSDSTTIHWHGLHQAATPYMDGVPLITQCGIQPGNTFVYRFPAAQTGTHFYHSHLGLQRGDGMFGALVIRQPKLLDPHHLLYDYDLPSHTMIINDWEEQDSLQSFLYHYHSIGGNLPTSMLVNGKGWFEEFVDDNNTVVYTPIERFYVESQNRYRFRIINSGVLTCPIQLSVDNHTITVISTDGHDVRPVEAESVVSFAGERFDIIINANHTGGVFWMRFRGLQNCANNSVHQLAVLHYEGSPDTAFPSGPTGYEDSERDGLQINAPGVGTLSTTDEISVATLSAVEDAELRLKGPVDLQYITPFTVRELDNPLFHRPGFYGFHDVPPEEQRETPQMNSVTLKFLPIPLLSQRNEIPPNAFCNESTISASCETEFCACVHVVQVPLNAVVEMIFVDESPLTSHPIHIHGLTYRVIGMEYLGGTVTADLIREMDRNGTLIRNFDHPPLKDTVQVPPTGYTIVRFIANNPGYWFMHCHLELHTMTGMGLILKFGEHKDMLPVPPNFPRCGNYDVLHP